MVEERRGWRAAMSESLYGTGGFYVSPGAPARHFRTSAHESSHWPWAVHRLASIVDRALGEPPDFAVLDVGAGGGELLAALATTSPPRWSLIGVDLAPRPASLPERVQWFDAPPSQVRGLLLANELLDVVPVDVVEMTAQGPRLVEVGEDGRESLGGPPSEADTSWLRRWWPLQSVGDRAEIGRPRDDAWRGLTQRLTAGVAVAVDYAAVPARDVAGTLTGFRDGRQVIPVPDGSCDLTAHVRFDSLAAAGDLLVSQRDALRWLGLNGSRPAYAGDPAAYLAALSAAGDAAALLDPDGLGGFTWLVHQVGVDGFAALAAEAPSEPAVGA